MTYSSYENINGITFITRTDADGTVWNIPTDPANSDYQAYLAYVANGNQTPTITCTVSTAPNQS